MRAMRGMHSDDQVEQLVASIKEFGWTMPVIVDEQGTLIAGHGRVLAAKKLGFIDIPTIVVSGWSEERKKAYRLADNKLPLNSTWDEGLLKAELLDLKSAEFDFAPVGFSDLEVADLTEIEQTAAEERERSPGLGNSVIQYNIVFDDAAQQEVWFGFVRRLKAKYPDVETLGARST